MIREVIVVEGRSDTAAIKRAVEADTIETGGSALSAEVLEQIRLAQERRGVIVFTDPDYPGEQIRKTISRFIPGCKHAFITQDEGRGRRNLGIENANPEVIRKALEKVRTESPDFEEQIPFSDLIEAGLVGGPGSKERRVEVGRRLGIGYTNAGQLHKRLRLLQITREEFLRVVDMLEQKESNNGETG